MKYTKPLVPVIGLAAACAACCTIPVALPLLLAGTATLSVWMEWPVLALAASSVTLAGTLVAMIAARRKAKAASCDCAPTACALPSRNS